MSFELQSLLWILLVPLLGAVGIALANSRANLRESVTLITACLLIGLVFQWVPALLEGQRPYLHLIDLAPGLSIALKLEPLGMLFACLASGLWLVNSVYSIGYMRGNHEKHQTRFYICFAIAISAAMGIAMAENLLTLFVFYEVLTLSTYPLVAHKGNENAKEQARVYLGILLTTSIGLLLPAMFYIYSQTGTLAFTHGGIFKGDIEGPAVGLLLLMMVLGVGKAAVMPVHKWLPAAMVAPTPVSALLHAVAVVKAGVFTVTKLIVYIFGADYLFTQPGTNWLIPLACFTIIAASVVALKQNNLKRMLAYSTIAQLSYVVLAAALLTPLGQVGTALHMLAHAFGKITLFFAAGAIYVTSHKTDITQLNGIGHRMPLTMVAFSIGALSMIGLPPTAGGVSKWWLLGGAIDSGYLACGFHFGNKHCIELRVFLTGHLSGFFMEEDHKPQRDHKEAPWPMVLALSTTAMLCLGFSFFNEGAIKLETLMLKPPL